MQLSSRTTLLYLLCTVPLFLLGSWLLYRGIEHSLLREVDEELMNGKKHWVKYINDLPTTDLPEVALPMVNISKTDYYTNADRFSDTVIFQEIDKEMVPYRTLTTYHKRGGQSYRIISQYTMVEKDDVIKYIWRLMGAVFLGMLLLFLLINYFINKIVWRPFNSTLAKITAFNMRDLQKVDFEKTSIQEFAALNIALKGMTKKIHDDYLSMKTFTENASHEIQTPLAIIQSKLELLLQDESVTRQQAAAISAARDASQRLSRLNQALLLITKIENNQFKARDIINVKCAVEKYLSFFEELMEKKQLTQQLIVLDEMEINMHPMLLDILVSNLMSNAVRYNKQQGDLIITIDKNLLVVKNSSPYPAIDQAMLFERFSKQDGSTGNGLGLAIVKEICDANALQISYSFTEDHHQFAVSSFA